MTNTEAIVVGVVVIAGTVASVFNHFTPELGTLLGLAIGYAAKGTVSAVKSG